MFLTLGIWAFIGPAQQCWLEFTLCTIHRPCEPLGQSPPGSPDRGTRLCCLQSFGAEVIPKWGEEWVQVGSLPDCQVETRGHLGSSFTKKTLGGMC